MAAGVLCIGGVAGVGRERGRCNGRSVLVGCLHATEIEQGLPSVRRVDLAT